MKERRSFFLTLELPPTAGQRFGGCDFQRAVNAEDAEIDDIDVVRDGDHLFFL